MAVASSPTSGHSSQAMVPLSDQGRACIKKYMKKFIDDLDDPALKTDGAFRKILEGGFFKFMALESQMLNVKEKEESQRAYPLNKRLFNHDGRVSSFILEEMRSNQSKGPGPDMPAPSALPPHTSLAGRSEATLLLPSSLEGASRHGTDSSIALESQSSNQSKRPRLEMDSPLPASAVPSPVFSRLPLDFSFGHSFRPPYTQLVTPDALNSGSSNAFYPPLLLNPVVRPRIEQGYQQHEGFLAVRPSGATGISFGSSMSEQSTSLFPSALPEGIREPVARSLASPAVPLTFDITHIAFAKEKWERYFGNIGEVPPLPPDIHQILQSPCPFWPDKKVEDTHILFLMPAFVNGERFTLNTLGELIQKPKQPGYVTKYAPCWDDVKQELGNQFCAKSYWVLMTKNILPDSSCKAYSSQCKILESYKEKAQILFHVPSVLEVATGILLHHVQSGTKLYETSPRTYTRCQEKHGEVQFVVGGFCLEGLSIRPYQGDSKNVGLAAARKL